MILRHPVFQADFFPTGRACKGIELSQLCFALGVQTADVFGHIWGKVHWTIHGFMDAEILLNG